MNNYICMVYVCTVRCMNCALIRISTVSLLCKQNKLFIFTVNKVKQHSDTPTNLCKPTYRPHPWSQWWHSFLYWALGPLGYLKKRHHRTASLDLVLQRTACDIYSVFKVSKSVIIYWRLRPPLSNRCIYFSLSSQSSLQSHNSATLRHVKLVKLVWTLNTKRERAREKTQSCNVDLSISMWFCCKSGFYPHRLDPADGGLKIAYRNGNFWNVKLFAIYISGI